MELNKSSRKMEDRINSVITCLFANLLTICNRLQYLYTSKCFHD